MCFSIFCSRNTIFCILSTIFAVTNEYNMKKYESYFTNPFKVNGLISRQYIPKGKEELVVDPNSREMYTMKKVPKTMEEVHDPAVYTKVFQDQLEVLIGLSPASMKIVLYMICNMRPLSDFIVLSVPDLMVALDIKSHVTIKNSIMELLDTGIIAQQLGSNIMFWINPNIFFNGNRVKLQ